MPKKVPPLGIFKSSWEIKTYICIKLNKNASGKNMSEWHWKISTLPVIDPALKNGAAISNGKDMKTT